MKYALASLVALGALLGVSAQAATVTEPSTIQTTASDPAVQKAQYYWHGRWRSHHRWGSRWGWHNRWRSHYRWGSRHWHYWHRW